MINFFELQKELQEARETAIIAEWKGCFEHVLMCMGQEALKRVNEGNYSLDLKSIELHLFNYQDSEYPDGFDEELRRFSYSTATLPQLTEIESLVEKLKISLQEELISEGWCHLQVVIETDENCVHVIAYTPD